MERKEKGKFDRPQMAWIQKMTGVCPTHGGSHSDWLRDDQGRWASECCSLRPRNRGESTR